MTAIFGVTVFMLGFMTGALTMGWCWLHHAAAAERERDAQGDQDHGIR